MNSVGKEGELPPSGRKKTDKSLMAERAKTDMALAKERKETEQHADDAVLINRAELDESRATSRDHADGIEDADDRLVQERQMTDAALDIEREHGDAVLIAERESKKILLQKMFHSERKETDRDLTSEREQIDVEVKRAVAALTTRDEFLAIVSHDLRNPLSSIAMATEMLAISPLYVNASKADRRHLEIIEHSANSALRLIGDLLDMERLGSGLFDLQIKNNGVKDIVSHAVKSLESLTRAKNLTVQVRIIGDEFDMTCDGDRVAQVLSNLLGNAIKFTPEGGTITVTAQEIAGGTQISVADTGPGIPKDMQQAVFERFSQIKKHDRRGLGLGLYISKMIVEAHKGRIWVESTEGKGSVFHFTLKA